MWHAHAKALLLVVLAGSSCVALADEPSFGERLQRADVLRSSDQQEFSRLIASLELDAAAASREQRQHLALLKAYRLTFSGDTPASIERLEALLAEEPSPVLRVRAGALLANNYAIAGKFIEGASMLEKTLEQVDQVKDKEARHQALTTAAILYNLMGQYGVGRRFAERVLADEPGKRLRCFAQNLRLESLLEVDNPPAIPQFESAIDACVRLGEQVVAGFARSYLARKLHGEGETRRAIAVLESHLSELKSAGYPRVLAEVYSLLAKYHFETGQFGLARGYADQTINLADQPASIAAAHYVLYQLAARAGDQGDALKHYRAYAEADKAHSSEANAREMAYQVVRQESRSKSQQIALLNRQNDVLQLQRQVDRQSAENMKALIALALLLMSAIAYWAWRVKRMEHVLRQRSEVDALTGVASRQYFCSESIRRLRRCEERRTSVALVMFDLDHFKDCNDRHGHEVGDWVLHRAAQACAGACRKGDLVGRLGGEEFALLLLDIDREGALRVAETCRQAIENINSESTGKTVSPTASFGVAMATTAGYDLTMLLSQADKALYRAKHDGRNRVRAHDAESLADPTAPRLWLAHPAPAAAEQ